MSRARLALALALALVVPFEIRGAYAAVTGTIISTEGQAISGAKVAAYGAETIEERLRRLSGPRDERVPIVETVSDAKGDFSLDTKKEPAATLLISAAGFAPASFLVTNNEDTGPIALTVATLRKGRVTAGGKGIPEASVVWFSAEGAEYRTRTDKEGSYSVPDPDKWEALLRVTHPDFATAADLVGRLPTMKATLDRSLTAGQKITGRVVAADGKTAIANARITVDGSVSGNSREDGTFVLEHLADGWKQIVVASGDLTGSAARGVAPLTIRLTPAAIVTGTLLDGASQKSLPGALITIRPRESRRLDSPTASAVTDASGAFRLALPPGQYVLGASHPAYLVTEIQLTVTAGQKARKTLFGAARPSAAGFVFDDSRKPVAGAAVGASPVGMEGNRGGMRFFSTDQHFSGPDGRFVLRGVPADRDIRVEAGKKGFPKGETPTLHLAAGERKSGLLITIPRGMPFSGSVVDAAGKPVGGVAVSASVAQDMGGRMRQMMFAGDASTDRAPLTGTQGEFNIRLKEGKYDVSFRREGYAPKIVRGVEVGADSKPLRVVLEAGAEVSGRVVRKGAGIEGVVVGLFGDGSRAMSVSAADGSFTLKDLAPGSSMLMVSKPDDFIQQTRQISIPARDLVIEIPGGGTISGRVVEKGSKNPITDFSAGISNVRSGGGMMFGAPPTMKEFHTDDGTFTLTGVPPNEVQLMVSAAGYASGRVPGVRVEEGKPVSDIVVELSPSSSLSGRITGPDGSALGDAQVQLDTSDQGMRMRFGGEAQATSDPNGEYLLDSLDGGELSFVFSKRGYVSETRTVKISDKETRLDVRLSRGAAVNGVVVTEAGTPVAEARVSATSAAADNSFGRTVSDANGAFHFDGLAPAHYSFGAGKTGFVDGQVSDIDITTGAPVRIVLRSGGSISGHVTGLSEGELSRATVIAEGSDASTSAPVDASGAYRIDAAPTGTVRISATTGRMSSSRRSAPRSVDLAPGSSAQVDLEFRNDTSVRGRVTKKSAALAGVAVVFAPKDPAVTTRVSTNTDAGGNYEAAGLDPGDYLVRVIDMQNLSPYSTEYHVAGNGTFDIDIKTNSVRGHVLDIESGRPITGVRVSLQQKTEGESYFGQSATTDMNGTFVIEPVAPGDYRARAEIDQYGQQIIELTLGDGDSREIEFKLEKQDGLRVRILDGRDGRTLEAMLTVKDSQDRPAFQGFADSGGDAGFHVPLSRGTYRVTAWADGYAARTVTVAVPAPLLAIPLTPGGSLVLHSASSEIQRAKILSSNGETVSPSMFARSSIIALQPGDTTVEHLAPDTYQVLVLDERGETRKKLSVTIAEGGVSRAEL